MFSLIQLIKGSHLFEYHGLSTRIIIIGWITPISVLVASYSAALMSFITHPGHESIPETFNDLVRSIENRQFTASTMVNSAIDHFIVSSTEGLPFRLKTQMLMSRITVLNVQNKEEYERVLKEKHAVIFYDSTLIINADKIGLEQFFMSEDNLFCSIQVWGMRNGFVFKEKFNKLISYSFEGGFFHKFLADEMNKVRRMRETNINIDHNIDNSLSLHDTAGAFTILIIGYIISVFSFFLEKCFRK
ncbi:uncharacterized protein LOC111634595 isoform X1 [Centruroides sculpturatus]|uniref:uncharacterized protein LOC111634595 isoform X1 n=2 Tax=Centruroides sculpturatus TaxID=218467 RepID=UPI000C6D13FF|nr:uncharacterized protein LOC111634595 isoform X1 [Centruroides sculpturatus]